MLTLLCAALVAHGQTVDEVPFRIGDDAIIVDVTVNGRQASLMFDTGFSGTVILGDTLDIGKPSGTMTMTDFVGSFEAKTVPIKTLKIGGRTFDSTGLDAVQQPVEHYTMAYGTHCDGILGFEPFGRSVVEINFEKQKFVFHPDSDDLSKRTPDGKRTFLSRLLPRGINSIQMSVDLAGTEKLHMALDTGNSGYAVTHKDSLERTKVWQEGKKADFMAQSVVASGPVDTFHLALKNVTIFGVPVPECVFGVIDLPSSQADFDGTIGFGFLKNFNVTVDMLRRRVWFENFTGRVSDPEPADVGILAFIDPRTKRMRVYSVIPGSPADKSGIKRGDDLLAVDGQEVAKSDFRRVSKLLKGSLGSRVKLDLSRAGQLMRVEVERASLVNSAS